MKEKERCKEGKTIKEGRTQQSLESFSQIERKTMPYKARTKPILIRFRLSETATIMLLSVYEKSKAKCSLTLFAQQIFFQSLRNMYVRTLMKEGKDLWKENK